VRPEAPVPGNMVPDHGPGPGRSRPPVPLTKSFSDTGTGRKDTQTRDAPMAVPRKEATVATTMTTSVSIGKKPDPVTLTDNAASKVAQLLAEEEGGEELALRVAVKPGGCSGYSYEMFFDSELASDDIVRHFGGVRVIVDPASAELLTGATLDFSDGLQGAGFHITNPNATRTCGCGSSFS
jgi:iron-sulfur cluster assembly accessory protein